MRHKIMDKGESRMQGGFRAATGLHEGIRKAEDKVLGVFAEFCRKHNNNMRAVWTEFNSYLERNGKTKTLKALREAANRMSALSTNEAVRILEKMGFESRCNSEVVVTLDVGGASISITMPRGNHTLRNRDYANKVICAALGSKGSGAFEYLQRTIGDKATKSMFRKAAEEMGGF